MKRSASCSCGALQVSISGEPTKVSLCHCGACKKRTGSSFGVAVFYDRDRVALSGPSSIYERMGESGKRVTFHFCPDCGATVYWLPEFRPGSIAIAIGAFDEQEGLSPTQSVYEHRRHPWIAIEIDGRKSGS